MNMNHIFASIQESELQTAIDRIRQNGHVLTQPELIALIVVTVIGALLCLFGLKLIRVWSGLVGLILGAGCGYTAAAMLGAAPLIQLIGAAAAGIILAILGAAVYRAGVFLTVFAGISLLCLRIVRPTEWIPLAVCLVIGLVAALLAIRFVLFFTILATDILGALTGGTAVYYMIPYRMSLIHIGICIGFFIIGGIVQLSFESGKRKRQNLKRAAEIRDHESTAKEVERARAMIDELDGTSEEAEAPKEEQLSDNKSKKDKKKKKDTGRSAAAENAVFRDDSLQTVSLDDLEDYDDELDDDEWDNDGLYDEEPDGGRLYDMNEEDDLFEDEDDEIDYLEEDGIDYLDDDDENGYPYDDEDYYEDEDDEIDYLYEEEDEIDYLDEDDNIAKYTKKR